MRDVISALTTMYSTICRGKGIVKDQTLQNIAIGAHGLTDATVELAEAPTAPTLSKSDMSLLREARKIDEQIEEITVFLLSMEIV